MALLLVTGGHREVEQKLWPPKRPHVFACHDRLTAPLWIAMLCVYPEQRPR